MCLSEPRCWSTPTNWLAYQNLGLRRHESGHYVRWNFPWEKIGLVVKNKRLVLELHNPACKYTNPRPSVTNPTLCRHRLRPEAFHKIKSREVQRHGQTHQRSQRSHGGRLDVARNCARASRHHASYPYDVCIPALGPKCSAQ